MLRAARKRDATAHNNPEHVDDYDVIHDRDGCEQVLSAALGYAKQEGRLTPNRETGAVTRQKRFDGTGKKPRFVQSRKPFLDAAKGKGS